MIAVILAATTLAGWFAARVEGVNLIGTVASIIGLGITIHVAFAVAEIRRGYVSRAMLGTGLERLVKHQKNLESAISRKNPANVRKSLANCLGLLLELARHLPIETNVVETAQSIRRLLETGGDVLIALRAADLLPRIAELIERLRLQQKHQEWGGHDG